MNTYLYLLPQEIPNWLYIFPQVSFTRLFYHMTAACSSESCVRRIWDFESEAQKVLVFLYITPFLYFITGFILDSRRVGHKDSIFRAVKNLILGKIKQKDYPRGVGSNEDLDNLRGDPDSVSRIAMSDTEKLPDQQMQEFKPQSPTQTEEIKKLDFDQESVRIERKKAEQFARNYRANSQEFDRNSSQFYPLVVENLQKTYYGDDGSENHALKGVSLCIKKGEVFGLLGENGAGKTTILSILYGMQKPDSGTAYISGFSIRDQLHNVFKRIGVCPQFNLFWPELTVHEHLLFYQQLKGSNNYQLEVQMANKIIKEVNLSEHAQKQARQLSGGTPPLPTLSKKLRNETAPIPSDLLGGQPGRDFS